MRIWRPFLPLCVLAGFARGEIRFCDRTDEAGLRHPLADLMGHGAAWGDLDGDGDLDLFVGSFADRPDEAYGKTGKPVIGRVFVQQADGTFIGQGGPTRHPARTSGAVFADLDNDGDPELYVANNAKASAKTGTPEPQATARTARSRLFENQGGSFVARPDCGAVPEGLLTARNVGVFDFDGDRLLDLLVIEDKFTQSPNSSLFRNLGGLKFEASDLLPKGIHGLGLAVGDVNGDRRPDFFVGHSNRFFVSRPGGGWHEPEDLRKTFAWEPLDGEDWPCGAAFGDLNGDGLPDLALAIHGRKARNKVFLHRGVKDGVPLYEEVTGQAGLPEHWPEKCPHVEIQDFDNDGRPDLYFSSGWKSPDGRITPLIYRNVEIRDTIPRFKAPSPGPDDTVVYFPAGPSADYDGDGRVDLFLVNWFEGNYCRLLRNDTPAGNWLEIEIVGRSVNRMGIGAVVSIETDERRVGVKEVSMGYGYASGQPPTVHFGLGEVDKVTVRVTLPNGKEMVKEWVKANQKMKMEE